MGEHAFLVAKERPPSRRYTLIPFSHRTCLALLCLLIHLLGLCLLGSIVHSWRHVAVGHRFSVCGAIYGETGLEPRDKELYRSQSASRLIVPARPPNSVCLGTDAMLPIGTKRTLRHG